MTYFNSCNEESNPVLEFKSESEAEYEYGHESIEK